MATLFKADGTITEVTPENGKKFRLDELQLLVGGFIEAIPGTNNKAWANEEGLIMGLPQNVEATNRFHRYLVGDVVLLSPTDKM